MIEPKNDQLELHWDKDAPVMCNKNDSDLTQEKGIRSIEAYCDWLAEFGPVPWKQTDFVAFRERFTLVF
jgi:hypothetical protein